MRAVVSRIAVLHHGSAASPAVVRFRQALLDRVAGHGPHCVIDEAGADRQLQRIPRLVAELLSRGPDVLVAIGAVAALAAQDATQAIPVLHATVIDPPDIGLTAHNLAGVTTFDPLHAERQLRLLRHMVPGLRTVACLFDPEAPRGRDGISPLVSRLHDAAQRDGIGLRLIALDGSHADVEAAIENAREARATALVALEHPSVLGLLNRIVSAAERCALPTLLPQGYGVQGTATLGPGLPDAAAALAEQVVAVLRGRPVAELAVRRVHDEHRCA